MSAVFRTAPLARSGEQLVWFRRLGYVRIRDLARIAVLVGVVLTALVTLLTSDTLTLVFLILFAAAVLKLTAVDQYFSPRRRVNIYPEGELFIAEHLGTGVVRHGETPEEALSKLDDSVTPL